jgi:Leucine-rich repeat (LRR) protein
MFTAYKGHVVSLVIYNQNLKDIPDFILDFSRLQELYIAHTYSHHVKPPILESIPQNIGKLSELRVLRVYRSKLQSLPSSITNLKKLKKLAIIQADLRALPTNLGKLKALKQLDVSYSSLEEIPESIGGCISLKEIDLRFNSLTFIPDSVGFLPSLQKLNLYGNQIQEIPASFKNLTTLEELYLGSNNLKTHSVPEWLFSLKSLKKLLLDENKNNKNKTIIVSPEILEKAKEQFDFFRLQNDRFFIIKFLKKQ